jgi:AraC-like DNA-binding protein
MASVDTAWLAGTRAAAHEIVREIAACELGEMIGRVTPLVAAMRPPPDLQHQAALTLELLDAFQDIVDRLHDRTSHSPCMCHALSWSCVGRLTAWQEHDPRLAFLQWLQKLLERFDREHPLTAIGRAAALVRADPTQCWTLDALSAHAGLGAKRLRVEFERHFGVKPSAYVHLVRATRAVTLFRTPQKVEAVAWDVGYRSKKDLYAALERWVGATPTELRQLSALERDWLERQLRMRCLRGPTRSDAVGGHVPAGKPTSRRRTRPHQATRRLHM